MRPESLPPLALRRLGPLDARACRDHLLRLEPEQRRLRFSGTVGEAAIARHVAEAFEPRALLLGRHVLIGAVQGALPAARVVGLAELRLEPGRREAEAAFSVERAHRKRGVGARLFARVLLCARNRGVSRVHVRCLAHNVAMHALARRLGLALRFVDDEIEGVLALDPPTPLTLVAERMGDLAGWMGAFAAPAYVSSPSPGSRERAARSFSPSASDPR